MTKVRRNPEGVIRALERATAALPELRVGQLVASASFEERRTFDPFNMEDDALIDALDRLVSTHALQGRSSTGDS